MKKILLTLVLMCAPLVISTESKAETPADYAKNLADKVLSVITSNTTEDNKQKQLVDLFRANVDTEWMGRFVLGSYYREATPEQQKQFIGLYTDYVIYSYIPKFRLYSGEKMTVDNVIDEGDGISTVKTTLATEKSSTGSVLVDYKVKKSGNSYKIVDITGEGVSLISTQRSDFSGALANSDLATFMQKLATKVEYLKTHPQTQLKKDNVKAAPAAQ